MSAHTLGPWIAADVFVNNSPNRLIVRQAKYGGDVVADLGHTEHANMSNAQLIAAAPELLAALQDLLGVVGVRIDDPRIVQFDRARAAIARATEEA